jgi:catalase (peroxidase I)
MDASQEQTDVESIAFLEPAADVFAITKKQHSLFQLKHY